MMLNVDDFDSGSVVGRFAQYEFLKRWPAEEYPHGVELTEPLCSKLFDLLGDLPVMEAAKNRLSPEAYATFATTLESASKLRNKMILTAGGEFTSKFQAAATGWADMCAKALCEAASRSEWNVLGLTGQE